MNKLNFLSWFLQEANLTILSNQETCRSVCPKATVVWMISLDKVIPELEEYIQANQSQENPVIIGLQTKMKNVGFYHEKLKKITPLIPQEEQLIGIHSKGAKPVSMSDDEGTITIRPEKILETDRHGKYEDQEIRIPVSIIKNIKAIGGCAVTCLHLSGTQVSSKTVGGYLKTRLYKTDQNIFYNKTIEQYIKSAIKTLVDSCRNELAFDLNKSSRKTKGELTPDDFFHDHYAVRLNGTSDLSHHLNTFNLDPSVIKSINKYVKLLNQRSAKNSGPKYAKKYKNKDYLTPLVLNTISESDIPQDKVNFYKIFNALWSKITENIACAQGRDFVHFYDYTAVTGFKDRYLKKQLPDNYHVTFSLKEGNIDEVEHALENGMAVAVPIWISTTRKTNQVPMPEFYYPNGYGKGKGYRIINGDLSDARFLDRKTFGLEENEGYVVGLRAKGRLEELGSYDSGFAERVLQNTKIPQVEALQEFSKRYNGEINESNFQQAQKDFINISGSKLNPRFNPKDPAVNTIIFETIVYILRKNGVAINGKEPLRDKSFYDTEVKRGASKLKDVRDIDWEGLNKENMAMTGTSSKTDKGAKGVAQPKLVGTSAKVEKGEKGSEGLKVMTHQMNMLPHSTYLAVQNMIDSKEEELSAKQAGSFSEWVERRIKCNYCKL